MKFTVAKKAIALTGAVAMLGSVAACGSDTASGKPAQDKDVTEITVWAWEPTLTQVAKDFTKKTGIKVDLKNVGTNTKEYTQLDNAIEAGSGAPDVAQVEYYAIPQYAIKGNLLDITDKTSGYSDFYTPGPWASVQFAGKVYGLPMDSGPMAFFYNKEVFDKAGVDAEQIKTWDQYYDAAKKTGDGYETIVWTYYDNIVVGKADITRQFAVQNIVVDINNRYQFVVSVYLDVSQCTQIVGSASHVECMEYGSEG